MTPLHDAVLRKDTEIVKVLIKFGANPTIKNSKDDKSPIDQASDKEDILQVLKTSSYLHNNEIKPVVNGIKENEADNQHHTEESNSFQEVSSSDGSWSKYTWIKREFSVNVNSLTNH